MKKKELKNEISRLRNIIDLFESANYTYQVTNDKLMFENKKLRCDVQEGSSITLQQKSKIDSLTKEIAHLQNDLKEQADIIHNLNPELNVVQGKEVLS